MPKNLTVEYTFDDKGELPIVIAARNKHGALLASARKIGSDGEWELNVTLGIKEVTKKYDHSGPAIEAHSWFVSRIDEFLTMNSEVNELQTKMATAISKKHQIWDALMEKANEK